MMRSRLIFLVLVFLFTPTIMFAQSQLLQDKENIYAVVKDIQGDRLEGYLRVYPNEITVSTKDHEEKSIPLKIVDSIKVEKIQGAIPGADQPGSESYYSVRLQNSQEIFTLSKKVTISLNTTLGVVTKTLDPETIQDSSRKDSTPAAKPESTQPFIRDKSVILSLEIKF